MRVARASRGLRPPLALAGPSGCDRSPVPLFIRCYERGERVHLAMLCRGYTGSMPVIPAARRPRDGRGPSRVAGAAAVLP